MAQESKASSSQTAKSGDKVFWNVRDAGGSLSKQEESAAKKAKAASTKSREQKLREQIAELKKKQSAPAKKVNAEKPSTPPSAKVSRMTLRRLIDKLEADPSPAAKERLKNRD